jgi:hypothetical protein
MAKQKSRTTRWSEAAGNATTALEELYDIQQEYQDWLDGLPENLQNSALGEKLQAVCDIDLESAKDAVEEADGADLPLGFGRD